MREFAPSPPLRDTWVFFGLALLLIWAPIPLGSNRTWAVGVLLLVSIALSLGFLWTARAHLDWLMERLRQHSVPLGLLLLFNLWIFLQTLPLPALLVKTLSPETWRVHLAAHPAYAPLSAIPLSLDVFQTRIYGTVAFVYFLVFLLVLGVARDARRIQGLALVLVLSGVAQALFGLMMLGSSSEYQYLFNTVSHHRLIGTFRYHNNAAAYLALSLCAGIGLMLAQLGQQGPSGRHWKSKVVVALQFMLSGKLALRLMLVILVIGLVLTRSRMGNVAFMTALLLAGLLTLLLRRHASKGVLWLIVSLLVVDVAVVGNWIGLEKLTQRLEQTRFSGGNIQDQDTIERRGQLPVAAARMVRDFPMTGTGGWSFYASFFRYRPAETPAYYEHAHNDYVEIASDTGLPGLGLLLGFASICVWRTLRSLRNRRHPVVRGIGFGSLMALLYMALHSLTDFNLQIPAVVMTFMTILALGLCASALPRRD